MDALQAPLNIVGPRTRTVVRLTIEFLSIFKAPDDYGNIFRVWFPRLPWDAGGRSGTSLQDFLFFREAALCEGQMET